MGRLLAFVLHATTTGVMAWGWFSFHRTELGKWVGTKKGGHSRLLTYHGLVSAWSCMIVSLLCDVFPSMNVVRHLKKTLLMISMPLAFIITTIYWCLLLFAPTHIKPPRAVPRFPLAVDLAVHAVPLITLSLDFFVFDTKFSKTYVHKIAPAAAVVLPACYASFVEYCAAFDGSFPYPFLTHNPFIVRFLIYTVTAGIILGCFRVLNALHA